MALFGFDLGIVPDINFAVKDASIVERDVMANYERFFFEFTRVQKRLARTDPVRFLLLAIIYQLVNQRSIVDSTGKMNLIKYSRDDFLDNIGARWGPGLRRLPAQSAATILRFSLSNVLNREVIVRYGQRAETFEGIQFQTTREAIIPAGQLFVNVPATAVVPGSQANDIPLGEVRNLVQWNTPYLVNVSNIVVTSGGADREGNERYRARIWMAPEKFPTTGSYGAYEFWGATANANIIDIGVYGDPTIEGQVWLYPLMEGGRLPTDIEKDQVAAICSADDMRPLTDLVTVKDPEVVDHTVDVTYYIEDTKALFADSIREGIRSAYEEYTLWQKSEMGIDVNFSKLTEYMMKGGAKRITPGHQDPQDPDNWLDAHTRYIRLDRRQLAVQTSDSDIFYGGLEPK